VAKRPAPVPRHLAIHRQSISPATLFRRLPVWVSKADIVAYLKLSPTDAQALFDSADRRSLIDGVERISKYQLQTPPYPDLIRVMQRHPSRPSIRRVFRAEIEKILRDPPHPQYAAFQKEFAKYERDARWTAAWSMEPPRRAGSGQNGGYGGFWTVLRAISLLEKLEATGGADELTDPSCVRALPKKSEWVFTKPNGRPYTAVRGFDKARKTAGLIDVVPNTAKFAVTVHTLRHTFATRLIEKASIYERFRNSAGG
jgi:hypothetical protein